MWHSPSWSERSPEQMGDTHGRQARRLANRPRVERHYCADRNAMLAALRIVLRLPRLLRPVGRKDDGHTSG